MMNYERCDSRILRYHNLFKRNVHARECLKTRSKRHKKSVKPVDFTLFFMLIIHFILQNVMKL